MCHCFLIFYGTVYWGGNSNWNRLVYIFAVVIIIKGTGVWLKVFCFIVLSKGIFQLFVCCIIL